MTNNQFNHNRTIIHSVFAYIYVMWTHTWSFYSTKTDSSIMSLKKNLIPNKAFVLIKFKDITSKSSE